MMDGSYNSRRSAGSQDVWLKMAEDAYASSTSYIDANFRKRWEDNIALFQSKHPADSKYHGDAHKYRSKIFRPKTRSVVRKNEAAAAQAFFSNMEVVSIESANPADQAQVISASLTQELLQHRLTKTIPWFVTLIGAFQETQVIGVVASYQYWKYKSKTEKVIAQGQDEFGNVVEFEQEQPKVIEDKPCVELIPIENIRFDAGADWTDVVSSSPYIIRMIPMYVCDVKGMMKQQDSKTGQPKWKTLDDGEIRQAIADYDSIRNAREGSRTDSKKPDTALLDYEIVWVHENFFRKDGEEHVFYTLGTQHMLTQPKPLEEVYFHGERPLVVGFSIIEAHKSIPTALAELGAGLQQETNEIANQRLDNVKLVLNKRWIVKRNKNVDIQSLNRNVPGGVTMADSIDDVQEINWPDVTGSAFQEQDRINVDFDELTGNFSQGSVMTNRKLNETVGGMQLMEGGAGTLTDYLIRTFVETWVEPVLRQLVKLEAAYETDLTVLAICGQKAQLQRYGIDQPTDDMLNGDLTVTVNVGMGSTNPKHKLEKFAFAARTYAEIVQALPGANTDEVRKEIFGLAGYRDGSRFFPEGGGNPQAQEMQQAIQQLQQENQALKTKQDLELAKIQSSERIASLAMPKVDAEIGLLQAQTVKTMTEAELSGDNTADSQKMLVDAQGNELDAQVKQLDAQVKLAMLEFKREELALKYRELEVERERLTVEANQPKEPADAGFSLPDELQVVQKPMSKTVEFLRDENGLLIGATVIEKEASE